ncbi:MAG TPA: DUF998 domain-containing protein [Candidatus Limnocylindria bacterium]|nr:DUF998 domain-containing protein [Candidatus Limnocylindria bacterium]
MNATPRAPRILALAGALEPVWLLVGSAAAGALRPGYDATHAISELGQQGSTYAAAWNVGGFGVAALLTALFALAIRDGLGRGWLFRVTVLQAIFLAAGGTFGCDPGCPPLMSTWQGWAHTVVGLVYFALTCVSPLVGWRTFRTRPEWRSLAPVSLAAGIALVGLFLAGPFVFPPAAVGVWQRITLATAGVWTTIVAVRLLRLASAVDQPSPTGRALPELSRR